MNRQAQAIVMLLFGGAILRASLTDTFLRYVKHGLRPFLLAAGVLLVTAAIMTLWHELRPRHTTNGPAGEHDDGHGHAHHEPQVGWLLLLPVLGLLLVTPPPLGSYSAGQAGTVLSAQNQRSDYPPLPDGDPVKLSLFDYASRAVFDNGATLTDRRLTLTGFITPGPDGQPMLARIMLTCCAADGRPIKVGLTGNVPSGLAADTWVELVGEYDPHQDKDPVNGATVPNLKVTDWHQTAAPSDPYE